MKNNQLSFKGQDIFVGVDVHKKSWSVSIYTKDFEHKTFSQNPDPEALINYLEKNFPEANYHCAYEAGYCGYWIHDRLCERGINCLVVNPADVPIKDKEKRRKTDRIDSRKLAKTLRSGELEGIFVPKRSQLEDRSLIRARKNAVKQQTRIKNQIKGLLSFYGIVIPEPYQERNWSGAFISWLENTSMDQDSGKDALIYYIEELKHYRNRIAFLNKKIRELAKTAPYKKIFKCLLNIPGIGMISAMILLSELVEMDRFKSENHLRSYIGLVPGERSSGEKESKGSITSRGNKYLRSILIEAAWVAVRKDPALLMCYESLVKRMKGQDAIIRIAKKLLSRIRWVWKNEKPYVIGVIE